MRTGRPARRAQLDRTNDFLNGRQDVIDDPHATPLDKAIAAHEQDLAQPHQIAQQAEVDAKLGRASAIPGPARNVIAKDITGLARAANGGELSSLGKNFARGVPLLGGAITAVQIGQAILVDHHSVGRSIAEGVGSTIGGAVVGGAAALGVGALTGGTGAIPAGIVGGVAGAYAGSKAADWLTDRVDDQLGIPH